MICPKCNTQLPDGAKFCGSCGNKLVEENIDSASRRNFLSNIKEFLMPLRAYAIPLSLIVFILILVLTSSKCKIHNYFQNEYIADAVQKELGNEKVPRMLLNELETLNLYDYSNEDLSELSKLSHLKTVKINSCRERSIEIETNNVQELIISNCDIENLDLSGCKWLTSIDCSNNKLKTLILPESTNEHGKLNCSNNELTSIDISSFSVSKENLICENAGSSFFINGEFYEKPSVTKKTASDESVSREEINLLLNRKLLMYDAPAEVKASIGEMTYGDVLNTDVFKDINWEYTESANQNSVTFKFSGINKTINTKFVIEFAHVKDTEFIAPIRIAGKLEDGQTFDYQMKDAVEQYPNDFKIGMAAFDTAVATILWCVH